MKLISKLIAIMASMKHEDVQSLSPVERERLAALCRHIEKLAAAPRITYRAHPPKSGVLADLWSGARPE